MPTVVAKRVIRLLLDMAAPETAALDQNTSAAPASYWRNPVTVQVGLKRGANYIDDVTGISKVTLQVKSNEYLQAGAYFTKEDVAPAVLTEANWAAKTHQSASFELTLANMTLPLKGQSQKFYVLVRVVMTDTSEYTAGFALMTVVDDGYVPDAVEDAEDYLTEAESDARYAPLATASGLTYERDGNTIWMLIDGVRVQSWEKPS